MSTATTAAQVETRRSLVIPAIVSLGLVLVLVVGGWGAHRFWPRELSCHFAVFAPKPVISSRDLRLESPSGILAAEVGSYKDELSAFLDFQFLRSLKEVEDGRVLLTASESDSGPQYRIYILLGDDLLTAVPYLAGLEAHGFISGFDVQFPPSSAIGYAHAQTSLFEAAYNRPIRRKLESLPPSELTTNIARFLLFKSKTDRRVREKVAPVPSQLTREQARDLAADIIAVAKFYQLPLEFFLGIGAMENNYMDVRGDLEHTTWKMRADRGDIVLKRRHGRVLVRNYSIGAWQITRETLRYAHELYIKDTRDYSKLPERLRPPRELDFEKLDSHILTTYAGLLFRDLLDRFGGDIEKAVGAYNGGPDNPNLQYAAGVEMVADYARSVLEQAAFINGRAIANSKLIVRATRPKRTK